MEMALRIRALANRPEESASFGPRLAFGEADDESEVALVISFGAERKPVAHRGKIPGRLPIRKGRGFLQSCSHQAEALGHHDKPGRGGLDLLQRSLDEIRQRYDAAFSGRSLEAQQTGKAARGGETVKHI